MNESEQAQAIAEIRAFIKTPQPVTDAEFERVGAVCARLYGLIDILLRIVDSQAQKIAELTKERDAAREYGVYMRETVNGLKNSESIHIGAMPWENE